MSDPILTAIIREERETGFLCGVRWALAQRGRSDLEILVLAIDAVGTVPHQDAALPAPAKALEHVA